ncbi:protein lmbr1l [Plakobranchus ocellatus]|uniref:Protein lmbr1l n=1 Tax=Plakobranchus ocellatus TaxID=259542 RepID=A0AAV4E075_9GAST|nr:protein lmbr1l [Plakobranchus ocellatus]
MLYAKNNQDSTSASPMLGLSVGLTLLLLYPAGLWLCTVTLTVSGGAVLLLPISIISNEVLLLYPTSYWIKWLNSSLILGLWNLVFFFSNLALFVLMPFAYFFTEAEGFSGSRKGLMARVQEASVVLILLGFLVMGLAYVASAIISGDEKSKQTLQDIPVTVSPHKSLNSFKGVIRSRDLKCCSEEEMVEELSGVTHARRIKGASGGDHAASSKTCPKFLDEQAILRYKAPRVGPGEELAPPWLPRVVRGDQGRSSPMDCLSLRTRCRVPARALWILKGDLSATFADPFELITINFLNGDQPEKGDMFIKEGRSSAFLLLATEAAPRAASVQGFFATSGSGEGSEGFFLNS